MIQKTIINLWGKHSCGKTETIRIIYDELVIAHLNSSHSYTLPNNNELSTVLNIMGYKVGIETMGDALWYSDGNKNIYDRLEEFAKVDNCDLIICAGRIRNDVSRHIEYMSNNYGYRLFKIAPIGILNTGYTVNQANQIWARQLLSFINDVLTGKV